MSLLQCVCKTLGILCLAVAAPALVFGQSEFTPQGGEYAPAGNLPGDQTHPQVSLNSSGGFLVWQDNITDGDGLGISAVRLDGSFSSPFGVFRVNEQGTNDQENPQVAVLPNGGAAFVWQGGKQGFQHIYARFLSPSNTWATSDLMVNTPTNFYQINPVVASLANGNVIVAWSSFDQDGSMQGVYAQQFTAAGVKVGAEIPINQFTSFNQRTPAVAALNNGGFVIAWVSEQERASQGSQTTSAVSGTASVDIYARLFNSAGVAAGDEFLVNTGTNVCANPAVAAASDGSFAITWGEKDVIVPNNSWDIFARNFSSSGAGGTVRLANTQRYGDQYSPKISSLGNAYLVVWTSLGQDGSREGVYGQFFSGGADLSPSGGEFRVNTTVISQQMEPSVTSDGASRFLVAWTSFIGGTSSFDLFSQRYVAVQQALAAPNPPFVTALSGSSLSITWPPLAGLGVSNYDLYVDDSVTPVVVTNNMWTITNLAPASIHAFTLDYLLTSGQRSPQSATVSGTTWGADANGDGLPDNWQALYWGPNPNDWRQPGKDLAPGGPTIMQVFQWGANPLDPGTWLTVSISNTPEGQFLNWNTVPGSIYQVQSSPDLKNWASLGSPRLAAGKTDSVYLGLVSQGYYQIVRLRY